MAALILLAARFLFQVPMFGSIPLLMVVMLVFIVANLAMGITFSTVARNQLQAMQMAFFFFLPSILLSGFMFPFDGMPRWAQGFAEILPLTHFVRIVRGILLRGASLFERDPVLQATDQVQPAPPPLRAEAVLADVRVHRDGGEELRAEADVLDADEAGWRHPHHLPPLVSDEDGLADDVRVGAEAVLEGSPTWEDLESVDFESPLVTPRPDDEERLVEAVRLAREQGETMGGVVGAVVRGLPPGLGSYVHWDRKLDGRIVQALVSIHSVKAATIGDGIEVASVLGSEAHDPYEMVDGRLERTRNRAGGLEGGVTNGADLVVRAFFKPISTLRRGLPSVDLATGDAGATAWERSDVTAIGAAPVIVEAMLALVLGDALLEKLGGDAIADVDSAWAALSSRLAPWWQPTIL